MHACPRDGTALVAHQVRGFNIRHCTTCAGLWLPSDVVAAAVGHVARPSFPHRSAASSPLRCPDDAASLVPIHHGKVEIDLCVACGGVWLDHGELDQIMGKEKGNTLVEGIGDVAELTVEGLGSILEFVGEALSGL